MTATRAEVSPRPAVTLVLRQRYDSPKTILAAPTGLILFKGDQPFHAAITGTSPGTWARSVRVLLRRALSRSA